MKAETLIAAVFIAAQLIGLNIFWYKRYGRSIINDYLFRGDYICTTLIYGYDIFQLILIFIVLNLK